MRYHKLRCPNLKRNVLEVITGPDIGRNLLNICMCLSGMHFEIACYTYKVEIAMPRVQRQGFINKNVEITTEPLLHNHWSDMVVGSYGPGRNVTSQ